MKQLIVLIGISSLALSNERSLSLEDAIKLAINNSLELSIAREQISLAKEREKQAKGEFLPKLNLKIETAKEKIKTSEQFMDFLGERINITPPSFPWKNNILLNVKQRIYSGGELSSKVRLTKAQREYLGYENEIIKQDLVFSVIKAYWRLKYCQHYLDFAKEKVDMIKTLLEIARKKKEIGKMKEIELKEEEIKKDDAEYELAIARNEKDLALNLFVSLLNIKEGFYPIDEPKIDPLNIMEEEFVANVLENNLKIKQYEKRVKEKRYYVAIAKSIRYPQVDMDYSLNYSGNKDEYKDAWDELKFSDWKIMLNINMSIYSGGIIQSKIREAEADLRIAEVEYVKVKNEIVSKAKEIFLGLKRKENQYKIQENALSLAKEHLKLKQTQYTLGNITQKEIIQSQIALNEAMIKLIEIKTDYEIAKGELVNLAVGKADPLLQ